MHQRLLVAILTPISVAWYVAGPVTYILCVVDTWQGRGPVPVKLLMNFTLDAFLAVIWPITWVIWFVMNLSGQHTPLRLLF